MSRRALALFALLSTVAFQGAVLAESHELRACPHHDPTGGAAEHHGAATATGADSDAPDHASHPEDRDEHAGWTCVGTCGAEGGVVSLAERPRIGALEGPVYSTVRDAHSTVDLPGQPAYFLPFAHGPPPTGTV